MSTSLIDGPPKKSRHLTLVVVQDVFESQGVSVDEICIHNGVFKKEKLPMGIKAHSNAPLQKMQSSGEKMVKGASYLFQLKNGKLTVDVSKYLPVSSLKNLAKQTAATIAGAPKKKRKFGEKKDRNPIPFNWS
jgi:hypothetical protein